MGISSLLTGMLSLHSAALSFAPVAPLRTSVAPATNVRMETIADLEALAKECNPVVGFYDPLGLTKGDGFAGWGQEETIGFLRQAEIKHGRVAMAGFVGFCVRTNGIHFPWNLANGISYESISAAGSAPAQWDALPTNGKLQILGFIGLLEILSESTYALDQSGMKHYMKGGKPGAYPSLKAIPWPHPVPFDLFDPFGLQSKMSPEKKAKGLVAEINNGRLAMLGMMGFVAESKVPGSVPVLKGLVPAYSGEIMAPFSAGVVFRGTQGSPVDKHTESRVARWSHFFGVGPALVRFHVCMPSWSPGTGHVF